MNLRSYKLWKLTFWWCLRGAKIKTLSWWLCWQFGHFHDCNIGPGNTQKENDFDSLGLLAALSAAFTAAVLYDRTGQQNVDQNTRVFIQWKTRARFHTRENTRVCPKVCPVKTSPLSTDFLKLRVHSRNCGWKAGSIVLSWQDIVMQILRIQFYEMPHSFF